MTKSKEGGVSVLYFIKCHLRTPSCSAFINCHTISSLHYRQLSILIFRQIRNSFIYIPHELLYAPPFTTFNSCRKYSLPLLRKITDFKLAFEK
jgi:hypothetical protein